jgi:hypothetical protein
MRNNYLILAASKGGKFFPPQNFTDETQIKTNFEATPEGI